MIVDPETTVSLHIIGESAQISSNWYWAIDFRMVMFTYLQHSDPTIPYYRKVRASSHKLLAKKWVTSSRVNGPFPVVLLQQWIVLYLVGSADMFYTMYVCSICNSMSSFIPSHDKDKYGSRCASLLLEHPLLWVTCGLSLSYILKRLMIHEDNLPAVTEAIRPVLGEYYNYDSTVNTLEWKWTNES